MRRVSHEQVQDEYERKVHRDAPAARAVGVQRVREVREWSADGLAVEEHRADELIEGLGAKASDEEDDGARDAALLLPELEGVEVVGEGNPRPRAEPRGIGEDELRASRGRRGEVSGWKIGGGRRCAIVRVGGLIARARRGMIRTMVLSTW